MTVKNIVRISIIAFFILSFMFLSGCITTTKQEDNNNEVSYHEISYINIAAEYNDYYDIYELESSGIEIILRISVNDRDVIPDKICLASFQPSFWDISNGICHTLSETEKTSLRDGKDIVIKFGPYTKRSDISDEIFPNKIPLNVLINYNRVEDSIFDVYISRHITNRNVIMSSSNLRFVSIQNTKIFYDPNADKYQLNLIAQIISGQYSLEKDKITVKYNVAAEDIGEITIEDIKPLSIFKVNIPLEKNLYTIGNEQIDRYISVYVKFNFIINEVHNIGTISIIK